MRYRRKALSVEAEQWRPGVAIAGVKEIGAGKAVVQTPAGLAAVSAGDWVLTDDDGTRRMMTDSNFRQTFEPEE